LKSND
jgi:hypothetical protein